MTNDVEVGDFKTEDDEERMSCWTQMYIFAIKNGDNWRAPLMRGLLGIRLYAAHVNYDEKFGDEKKIILWRSKTH